MYVCRYACPKGVIFKHEQTSEAAHILQGLKIRILDLTFMKPLMENLELNNVGIFKDVHAST